MIKLSQRFLETGIIKKTRQSRPRHCMKNACSMVFQGVNKSEREIATEVVAKHSATRALPAASQNPRDYFDIHVQPFLDDFPLPATAKSSSSKTSVAMRIRFRCHRWSQAVIFTLPRPNSTQDERVDFFRLKEDMKGFFLRLIHPINLNNNRCNPIAANRQCLVAFGATQPKSPGPMPITIIYSCILYNIIKRHRTRMASLYTDCKSDEMKHHNLKSERHASGKKELGLEHETRRAMNLFMSFKLLIQAII